MSGSSNPATYEMTPEPRVLERRARIGAVPSTPAAGVWAGPALLGDGERFAAYLAHELRTPLAVQRALVELALVDPATDLAGWREVGEGVLRACRKQERLLEACLVLARSRGGLQRCEPVDLVATAADALQAHDLNGLESVVVLQPAETSGDPGLIERLVANLVSNAVVHNVPGGRVDVVTYTAAGHVVFGIANTGPVVPADELRRLFQPFQRLTPHPSGAANGVGLGLAIVQAISEAHDATLTARPRPGGGLGVEVAFPALD